MAIGVLLAAMVGVLCPDRIVLVDTASAKVLREVALPGEGAAIFATPDGRFLVPMRGDDSTTLAAPAGPVERWRGRLFPLFFDEPDRLHTVLPGVLMTLSYPERLPLARTPLDGVAGAERAATSRDGRIVALVPTPPESAMLVIVAAREGGGARRLALGGNAVRLALAADGSFAVIATSAGTLEVAAAGEARSRTSAARLGDVRALALAGAGRDLWVGVATGAAGELVVLKVNPASPEPLKERFRTPLSVAPAALAVIGDEVDAVGRGRLIVLAKHGRVVRREVPIAGARDLAALPDKPATTVPGWSDALAH